MTLAKDENTMQLRYQSGIGSSDLVTHLFAVTESNAQHHNVLLGNFRELIKEE